jgi:integrase
MVSTQKLIQQHRKPRYQSGALFERCGRFYVKYRVNGQRVSRYLCDKDPKHPSLAARSVKLLRDDAMSEVNSGSSATTVLTVVKFWDDVYLPHAKKNLRAATVEGYLHIWKRWLNPHFGETALNEYLTETATEFLTELSARLRRNAYNHVRSLMSGIFSHAIAIGKTKYGLTVNPIHDAHSIGKVKTPKETTAYSLGELEDSISKLRDHVDAQLMLALAGFEGLRPSEIVGLKWSDVTDDLVCIRRAVVRGVEGDCKTPESVADLPLIEPVKSLFAAWRAKSHNPAPEAWVFPNTTGAKPVDLRDYTRRVFKPVLGDRYRGLYSARRSAATNLTQLMGNPIAASQLLRHKNMNVTMTHYIRGLRSELIAGMKRLEEHSSNRS